MGALDELLTDLSAAPRLEGARCRGRHELFDAAEGKGAANGPDVRARYDRAIGLCTACPALQRCAQWVNSLPSTKRPGGVVAGKVRGKQEPIERMAAS